MLQMLVPFIGTLIDRLIPDKAKAQEAKQELDKMEFSGELELLMKQLEVNKVEAQSENLFKSGWRPAAAWMCVSALFLGFVVTVLMPALIILLPVFGYGDVGTLKSVTSELKNIDVSVYVSMLLGMLGLGGLRSFDKLKGLAK